MWERQPRIRGVNAGRVGWVLSEGMGERVMEQRGRSEARGLRAGAQKGLVGTKEQNEEEQQRGDGTGLTHSGKATSLLSPFCFPLPPLIRLCLSPRDGRVARGAVAAKVWSPEATGGTGKGPALSSCWQRPSVLKPADRSLGLMSVPTFGGGRGAGIEGCRPQPAVTIPCQEAPETPLPHQEVQHATNPLTEDGGLCFKPLKFFYKKEASGQPGCGSLKGVVGAAEM